MRLLPIRNMRMAYLYPYLTFKNKCREAMTFYKECLDGDLEMQTAGESPMADTNPKTKDNIMHSTLRKNGNTLFMASDMFGDELEMNIGNVIELCLVCESKEEIASIFAKLSEGGTVTDPLKEEFFGTFGKIIDKFGVRWMFQFSKDFAHKPE